MPVNCPFCKIADGTSQAFTVFEDQDLLAFVDRSPIRRGHLQIIPKTHFDYFDDLPPELSCKILHLGQRLARHLKRLYRVERVGFVLTGGDVNHVHAHVIPLHEKTDITSRQYIVEKHVTLSAAKRLPDAEAEEVAKEILEDFESYERL
ncbi:MAG: HIT family protein [Pseudomonadota bacterium]